MLDRNINNRIDALTQDLSQIAREARQSCDAEGEAVVTSAIEALYDLLDLPWVRAQRENAA